MGGNEEPQRTGADAGPRPSTPATAAPANAGVEEPVLARAAVSCAVVPGAVSGLTVEEWIAAAGSVRLPADAAGLIDQLRILEDAKSAFSALQARISVAFDAARRRTEAKAGVPPAERGKGVAEQIALARRESPNRGARLFGLAKALVTEMPHTLATPTPPEPARLTGYGSTRPGCAGSSTPATTPAAPPAATLPRQGCWRAP